MTHLGHSPTLFAVMHKRTGHDFLDIDLFKFNPNRFLRITDMTSREDLCPVIAPGDHAVRGRAARIAAKRNAASRQRTPVITNAGR
jgi:hypothetical protein